MYATYIHPKTFDVFVSKNGLIWVNPDAKKLWRLIEITGSLGSQHFCIRLVKDVVGPVNMVLWSSMVHDWKLTLIKQTKHLSTDADSSTDTIVGRVNFCQNIQTSRLRVFIVPFGALISHTKFQHDSPTPSWSKFEIQFTIGITIGNMPTSRISSKKHFLMVLM